MDSSKRAASVDAKWARTLVGAGQRLFRSMRSNRRLAAFERRRNKPAAQMK
jgi:hypothetical protein